MTVNARFLRGLIAAYHVAKPSRFLCEGLLGNVVSDVLCLLDIGEYPDAAPYPLRLVKWDSTPYSPCLAQSLLDLDCQLTILRHGTNPRCRKSTLRPAAEYPA